MPFRMLLLRDFTAVLRMVQVPTVCDVGESHDWFRSVREGLYWNLRSMQSEAPIETLEDPHKRLGLDQLRPSI